MVLVFLIVEMSLSLLSEVAWMTSHKQKKDWLAGEEGNAPIRTAVLGRDRGDRQALTI